MKTRFDNMKYGVSVKEFTENGRRYVKVNESVCEVDDTIDMGYLLFNLLYCTRIISWRVTCDCK